MNKRKERHFAEEVARTLRGVGTSPLDCIRVETEEETKKPRSVSEVFAEPAPPVLRLATFLENRHWVSSSSGGDGELEIRTGTCHPSSEEDPGSACLGSKPSADMHLDVVYSEQVGGVAYHTLCREKGDVIVGESVVERSNCIGNGIQVTLDADKGRIQVLTEEEVIRGRLSEEELNSLPKFMNHEKGCPSSTLFIKNLAAEVKEEDLVSVFLQFQQPKQPPIEFRLMQRGRMRGQAFVTFPDTGVANRALNLALGYVLKGKPMIISFARGPKVLKTYADTLQR